MALFFTLKWVYRILIAMVLCAGAAFLLLKPASKLPVPELEPFITETKLVYYDYGTHAEKVTTHRLVGLTFGDAAAGVKTLESRGYTYTRRASPFHGQFGEDIIDIASSKDATSNVLIELRMLRRRQEIDLVIREPIAIGAPELMAARKFRPTSVTRVIDAKAARRKLAGGP